MATEQGSAFLGGAFQWFKDKFAKRVPPPRKSGAFHMWWQIEPGKFKPGVGMEIAVDSLVFIIEDAIPGEEFNIVIRVRDKNVPLHVRVSANDQVPNKGKTWHRYGVTYVGIAADNWDLIFRHVNDVPETEDKRAGEQFGVDDAYRMLPLAVQQKIVAMLVEQKKLEEPKRGQSPLLKMFYTGERRLPSGGQRHFFTINSRVPLDGEMMAYDTNFIIDDKGEVLTTA